MMSLVRMSAHLRNRARGLIKVWHQRPCLHPAGADLATRSVTTIGRGGLCSAPCRVDCVTVDSATDVRRLNQAFCYWSFSFFIKCKHYHFWVLYYTLDCISTGC